MNAAVTIPPAVREALEDISATSTRLQSLAGGWTTQVQIDASIAYLNSIISSAQAARSGLREVATPGPKLRRVS